MNLPEGTIKELQLTTIRRRTVSKTARVRQSKRALPIGTTARDTDGGRAKSKSSAWGSAGSGDFISSRKSDSSQMVFYESRPTDPQADYNYRKSVCAGRLKPN